MKHTTLLLLVLLLLFGSGCTTAEADKTAIGNLSRGDEMQAVAKNESSEQHEQTVAKKLIKNGTVAFETSDLIETRKLIYKAVEQFNGYVASDTEYKNSDQVNNSLNIRIPAAHFDTFLNEITLGVTKFDRKEIVVNDVTTEFLDIQARLTTKKELEQRYLQILQKATTVSDILEVEKQLGELRSAIESVEGQLTYLENQVSFSTLQVQIYQTTPKQNEFGKQFKSGFKNGWDYFIEFLVFLVTIWPFIFIILGLLLVIKAYRKRKQQ